MSDFVPPGIQRMMAELSTELGHPAQAQRLTDQRRWRITVASPRVTVTVDYKVFQRGRVAWCGSTLAIDGQRTPLARDLDHCAVIFADPDAAMPPGAPELDGPDVDAAEPAALITTCDPAEAPPELQAAHNMVTKKIGRVADVQARVGRDARGAWCFALDGPRVAFRLFYFGTMGRKGAVERELTGIQLFIDGRNRTQEVGNRLDKALGLLGSAFAAPPPTPPPPGRQVPVTTSNAVRERRHSVIRN